MSFLDTIVDWGSNLLKSVTGSGVVGGIAKSAALGYALKKVTDSINKDNQKADTVQSAKPDPGVRLQVSPDTDHSIPVVYGQAYIGGIITDAVLTNGNQTMWYCITLCEKTGNKINGSPSVISFTELYWDELKVNFQSDGVTVSHFSDYLGNTDTNPNGLIKIYPFNSGSTGPTKFNAQALGNSQNAYDLFPNWTSNHTMDNLVFALVRVDYNKEKNTTGLGTLKFRLNNSMNQAGDCLYDYMTNTRYGAGIDPTEIYTS